MTRSQHWERDLFLDKGITSGYNRKCYGPVAQLGAHHIRIVGVVGSNPIRSTKEDTTLLGGVLFGLTRIRTISMQQSGGGLLLAAAGCRETYIFVYENANESVRSTPLFGRCSFWFDQDSNHLNIVRWWQNERFIETGQNKLSIVSLSEPEF